MLVLSTRVLVSLRLTSGLQRVFAVEPFCVWLWSFIAREAHSVIHERPQPSSSTHQWFRPSDVSELFLRLSEHNCFSSSSAELLLPWSRCIYTAHFTRRHQTASQSTQRPHKQWENNQKWASAQNETNKSNKTLHTQQKLKRNENNKNKYLRFRGNVTKSFAHVLSTILIFFTRISLRPKMNKNHKWRKMVRALGSGGHDLWTLKGSFQPNNQ